MDSNNTVKTYKLFSRHTPNNLEKYEHTKLSEKELKRMSDEEIDDMIDEDADRASRNTNKYISKKLPKYLAAGTVAGMTAGSLLGGKGKRLSSAAVGSVLGTLVGTAGAHVRGSQKATEEGHGRKEISRKAAKRADKVKGGNAYTRMKEREDRRIQQSLDRERNRALRSNAAANRGW